MSLIHAAGVVSVVCQLVRCVDLPARLWEPVVSALRLVRRQSLESTVEVDDLQDAHFSVLTNRDRQRLI